MAEIDAPYCAPPSPERRRPRFVVPAGACDCHVHVFGPRDKYPYQSGRAYTPPDCPPDMLFDLHRSLGLERSVLVQASVHGTDNRAVLDAIALAPERLRGIASVGSDVSDAELLELHEGGIRGLRVNMVDKGGMPFASLAELAAIADRIADFGWHVELLVHVEAVDELPELVRSLSVPTVVGHFGYTKARFTVDHPGYRRFLDLVTEGLCWVKLTGPYRISAEHSVPYSDVRPFADALVERAPHRLLWGSDWPHVMQTKPMPTDADLLDLFGDWIAEEALQKQILSDNPSALYGFGSEASETKVDHVRPA